MLTTRMLGLLQYRLTANAPRQAGSHEYTAGVEDAVAAVRRLVGATETDMATIPRRLEQPRRTRLAAEYLRLEMRSLVWMIDSLLQTSDAVGPRHDELPTASLREARDHLVQAGAALHQTEGSGAGTG